MGRVIRSHGQMVVAAPRFPAGSDGTTSVRRGGCGGSGGSCAVVYGCEPRCRSGTRLLIHGGHRRCYLAQIFIGQYSEQSLAKKNQL